MIERLNSAVNIWGAYIVTMGFALAIFQPQNTMATALVSGGLGLIAGVAVGRTQNPNVNGQ